MLRAEGISFGYGQSDVLSEVSLEVGHEAVALIGANGAGKSTLVLVLSGIHRPRSGRIIWDGREITREAAHRIVRQGIAQVPEGRHVFPNQSVIVNLRLGAHGLRHAGSRKAEEAERLDWIFTLFPRLRERQAQIAGTLSGGEQQMLAIGRALMSRPRLLILDEPSMGLAPSVVEDIFEVLHSLRRQDIGLLLVEQNARLALALADRGYVLENGRIVMNDRASALAENDRVRRAYLGAAVGA